MISMFSPVAYPQYMFLWTNKKTTIWIQSPILSGTVISFPFRQAAKSLVRRQRERFSRFTASRAQLANFDLLDQCHRPNKRDSNPSTPDISRKRATYSGSTFTLSSLDSPPLYKNNKFSHRNYTVTTVLP